MTSRYSAAVLLLVLALPCPAARAAFYEFSITGEVTQSSHADVTLGDPFLVRYIINSEDVDPRPDVGDYRGTPATATFPNAVIASHGPYTPGMSVVLNHSGSGIDTVSYSHSDLNFYHYVASLQFPAGTLASDVLPLSLPLSQATESIFGIADGFLILGNITSYESAEVPEPGSVTGLLLVCSTLLARRSAGRKKR